MSFKKQAVLSAFLTIVALLLAPVLAGGVVVAEVIDIPMIEPVPLIAPFLYLAGFMSAAAILGAKGKKSAGIVMIAILAICVIASGLITVRVFGNTEPLPPVVTFTALPFMFLYSPAASLIYGFMESIDYDSSMLIIPYVAVYFIPIAASVAYAAGMWTHNNKAKKLSENDAQ